MRAALRRVAAATTLVLRVQARARFPQVFALYTGIVVAVLLWAVPDPVSALVLPALLVTEFGALGLSLVAAHRFLERSEGSASALLVSPLRPSEYVVGLALGSALPATAAGLAAFAAVEGLDGRLPALVGVLFPFAVLSGLAGFVASLRQPDFPRFVVAVVPLAGLWQAPLLAFYGVVPGVAVAWIPSAPAVAAIGRICADEPVPALLPLVGAGLALLGGAVAVRVYESRVRTGLEGA